jgi:hypothetical protein
MYGRVAGVLAALLLGGPGISARDYQLFFLGGQSNMEGFGYVRDLTDELSDPVPGVLIFHGNAAADDGKPDGRGTWSTLRPGHGYGFASDGKVNRYSERFGPELTFGRQLKRLRPDAHIAIIKYARGGASIAVDAAGPYGCWDPDYTAANGVNQWDHYLAALREATSVADIDGDGRRDRLIPSGIVWMQGEGDAHRSEQAARLYEDNLRRLMARFRASLRRDDAPVIIGRISSSSDAPRKPEDHLRWKYQALVRRAQAAFVLSDRRAALVTSTDRYGYSDPWHYDSAGYIDLGRRFADAIVAAD